LLLEQVNERRVSGEVAVLPRLAQAVAELATDIIPQRLALAAALLEAVRTHQHDVIGGRLRDDEVADRTE
jgi:hypothetical protein